MRLLRVRGRVSRVRARVRGRVRVRRPLEACRRKVSE